MLPLDHAQTFENAPLDDLLGVLLRQLKRPLASHGFSMSDGDAVRLARECVAGDLVENRAHLLEALLAVVHESEDVLARMGLTFRQSVDTDMAALGGWETTAEFLELANEKTNAELRITLGEVLALAFGGERKLAANLLDLAAGNYGDETVIARRVLAFVSGVDTQDAQWLDKTRAWAEL